MHTAGWTGFSGLKGCIGAEFLSQGSPRNTLTTEECENTQLGLSDMEANVFLSPEGGSLWCGCNMVASRPESFCGGDDVSLSTLAGASAGKHKYFCNCQLYTYLAQLAVCTASAF